MSATATPPDVQAIIERVDVSAYTVPTDEPESDGTAEWGSTTIVVVQVRAGNETGLGYTYAPAAAGVLVEEKLAELGGVKTLISHNYYSEDEFWQTWNKPNYDAVKAKTDPQNLFRDLYVKTCKAAMGQQ
jgi:hypothetical protein